MYTLGSFFVGACRGVSDVPPAHQARPFAYVETAAASDERRPVEMTEEALRIHRAALLIDGHNDLPWQVRHGAGSSFENVDLTRPQSQWHTDIPRLKKGGVGAQFWSAFVPVETIREGGATRTVLEQIDLIHRMARRYPETFAMAYTANDVRRLHKSGKIACLIGVEGGHTIENSLGVLRMLYALGVRYLTLTHVETIDWADSATDEARHGGLAPFGEQVVREMNRLGMLIDLSHVSVETMHDVLDVSRAPIIASHSSAYALAPHPRNIPDDVLRRIAENGGVVMVNFFSGFVHPQGAKRLEKMFETLRTLREEHPDEENFEKAVRQWRKENPIPRGTVPTVVDHIEHVIRVAGIDHVGLGSDFDGVSTLPEQLEDVSCFPYITQELLNRSYDERDIRKILGENALRALEEAERVAAESAQP